jgi:mono/diheme cytochrome c family protein
LKTSGSQAVTPHFASRARKWSVWCSPVLCLGTLLAVAAAPGRSVVEVKAQTAAAKAATTPAESGDQGRLLYKKYGCSNCHSLEGQGSTRSGPRLGPDPLPYEVFAPYVRSPTGDMPPYTEKVVSEPDLKAIYEFLKAQPLPPDPKTLPLLR